VRETETVRSTGIRHYYVVLGAVGEAGVAAPGHAVAGGQLAGALALEVDDGLGERVGVVEGGGEARGEEEEEEQDDGADAEQPAPGLLHG